MAESIPVVNQRFSNLIATPARTSMSFLLAVLLATSPLIIDGDTLIIDREHIRIANIDAPEIGRPKCDAERRLGIVAKRRLAELLSSVVVEVLRGDPDSGRKKDRYGRTLAIVSVDGQDVGGILIEESLARPWNGKRRPWCN